MKNAITKIFQQQQQLNPPLTIYLKEFINAISMCVSAIIIMVHYI